jgi:hypothetical protein
MYSYTEADEFLWSNESDEVLHALQNGGAVQRCAAQGRASTVYLRPNMDTTPNYPITFGKKIGTFYDGIYKFDSSQSNKLEVITTYDGSSQSTWGDVRKALRVAREQQHCASVLILGCKRDRSGSSVIKQGLSVFGTHTKGSKCGAGRCRYFLGAVVDKNLGSESYQCSECDLFFIPETVRAIDCNWTVRRKLRVADGEIVDRGFGLDDRSKPGQVQDGGTLILRVPSGWATTCCRLQTC